MGISCRVDSALARSSLQLAASSSDSGGHEANMQAPGMGIARTPTIFYHVYVAFMPDRSELKLLGLASSNPVGMGRWIHTTCPEIYQQERTDNEWSRYVLHAAACQQEGTIANNGSTRAAMALC